MSIELGTVVDILDIEMNGIVEDINAHEDGMVTYSIRCVYTGVVWVREIEDIQVSSARTTDKVRKDAAILSPASPECEIMKVCSDGFVITRGMVNTEISRTKKARENMRPAPMLVIGLNASSNMFG